ncbi:MAG TPA: PKD domain-containing protein [Candidatus Saccharimonadales bacterium]
MIRRLFILCRSLLVCGILLTPALAAAPAMAAVQNPQGGSVGIEGQIPSAPPTAAASISTPRSGQTFTAMPIQVSGLCTNGLLVKLFANNVFVGAATCEKGSYNLQVDLFSGRNDLVARQFDSFDQGGPDSAIVTVTFDDAQFNPFGTALLTLTSNYAERGADPGEKLTWPVVVSGGTSPYAVSVDWGDGKAADLMSTQFQGDVNLTHIYNSAGIYKVIIKASDKNGLSAFLQVVATANGAVTSKAQGSSTNPQGQTIVNHVLWAPAAVSVPLIFVSFWLGRKYELAMLRRHLEQRDSLDE